MKTKTILMYFDDPVAIFNSNKEAKNLLNECRQYATDNPQKTWDDYSRMLKADNSETFNKALYDEWESPRKAFNENHPIVVKAKWWLEGAYESGQTLVDYEKISLCKVPVFKPRKKTA